METKNVKFNKKERSVSLTITGYDECDYMQTIKALLTVMGGVEDDFLSQEKRFRICQLIEEMLPSDEQIMNIEDVKRLKEYDKNSKPSKIMQGL